MKKIQKSMLDKLASVSKFAAVKAAGSVPALVSISRKNRKHCRI